MSSNGESHFNGLHMVDDRYIYFGGNPEATPDISVGFDSTNNRLAWTPNSSNVTLHYFPGGSEYLPIQMGSLSSTDATKALYVSAANPRILDMHASDGDAAIAQGTLIGVSRARLMHYKSGLIIESYASHGLAKYASGITKGGWGAGVLGALETAGALTLAGQGEDTIAGIFGRVGISGTITCNDATARVAALVAFSNTQSSVSFGASAKYVGVLVRDGFSGGVTFKDFDYGVEIYPDVAVTGLYVGNVSANGLQIGGTAVTGVNISGACSTAAFSVTGTTPLVLSAAVTRTGQTLENSFIDLVFSTDSTYASGNITYSGQRGNSGLKNVCTFNPTSGGFHSYYSLITAGGLITDPANGVIGIKQVININNTGATIQGSYYGGQFIAKKSSSGIMLANGTLIGVEGWTYETDSSEVRTMIGGSFGYHADSSAGSHAAGSVWRGLQVFTDNGGTSNAQETTGIYIWGIAGTADNALVIGAGTWTDGINFIGTCTNGIYATPASITNFLNFATESGCLSAGAAGGAVAGKIAILVNGQVRYIDYKAGA